MHQRWLLAVTSVLLTTSPVGAQGVFTSRVDMVPLTVTVTDHAGRYVSGLTERDFAVFEDGVQQSVSFFASERTPVDVALVLDTSGSMTSDMPLVREAANGLIGALEPEDRSAVVSVSATVGMPQRFTADREQLTAAIDGLRSWGPTAVYDGVYIALREFERERRARSEVRRQVLVLLSDGQDNASHVSADDMAELAKRVGVNIYVIALCKPLRAAARHPTLSRRAARHLRDARARPERGRPDLLSGRGNRATRHLSRDCAGDCQPVRPGVHPGEGGR
jgi:VWFA-related protein